MNIIKVLDDLYRVEKNRAYRMEYNGNTDEIVRGQLNYAHGILKAKQIVEEHLNGGNNKEAEV